MAATVKCDTLTNASSPTANLVLNTDGSVILDGTSTLQSAGTGTLTLPAVTGVVQVATTSYTWPANAGTNGQVLTTNGSGTLTWTTPSGGGSGTVNAGTTGQLAYYAAAGTAVSGLTIGTGWSTALAANLGTGVQVALGNAVGTSGGLVTYNGVMGTGPQIAGSGSGTLTLQAQSAASGTLTLPNGPGTLLSVTATLTQGSVVFAGASGVLSEDNANFFWDDTNNRLGIGTATPATQLYVSKNAAGAISALGNQAAGTTTIDMATANNFSMTLTGNVTLANPTNLTAGQSGVIYVTQDATGSRTLAYGTSWDFPGGTAPTLTTTANAVDVLVYSVRTSTSIAAQLLTNIG
jgi:hypothetical protein